MRITVLTSCTAEKATSATDQLTRDDFARGKDHVAHRTQSLQPFTQPAEKMYTGQHHVRLMRGVEAVRTQTSHTLDLWILSAGYGLIHADQPVAPYDCTFNRMSSAELHAWAHHLGIPAKTNQLLQSNYDLLLVLLSNNYLAACKLEEVDRLNNALFFAGYHDSKWINQMPGARAVPLYNNEAKRFSCGVISLKGELAGRLLWHLATQQDGDAHQWIAHVMDPSTDILRVLDSR